MNDIIHPKKQRFLKNYPQLGQVTSTCEVTGIGRTIFYEWLKDDEVFKNAVNALKKEIDGRKLEILEAELHRRAMGGESKQSDILLMFELKAEDPGKYREKVADTRVIGDITIKLAIPAYDDNLRLNDGAIEGEYKEIEVGDATKQEEKQGENEVYPCNPGAT